jgi:type IV secretion system protein VirB9
MRRILLTTVCCALAMPAVALQSPPPNGKDQNSRTVAYDPLNPVLIVTNVGAMTDITFSAGERIKQMMFGSDNGPVAGPSAEAMQKAPLLANAPIWGKSVGMTSLTIVTIMPDDFTERRYAFVVKVKPKTEDLDPDATYWLTFSYTQQQRFEANPQAKAEAVAVVQKSAETWKQKKAREAREAIEATLRQDVRAGTRNWRYVAMGDASIAPCYDCTWDNTRQTGFRFNPNTTIPSVYVVDTPPWCDLTKAPPSEYLKAPERTAPADVKDDTVVVHETAQHFRFRLGAKVLEVWNCGYDPVGHDPMTTASVP